MGGILPVWRMPHKAIRSLRCCPDEDAADFAILELENNAPVDGSGHEASALGAVLLVPILLGGFLDLLLRAPDTDSSFCRQGAWDRESDGFDRLHSSPFL